MASDEGIKSLGNGRWAVRVKRIEKRTGREVNRKATVTGTKADARRVRDEIRDEIASTVQRRPRTRLTDYAVSWLERRAANPDMKRSVVRKYGYGLTHITPVLGDIYLDSITSADVASYIASRVAEVGIKGGNSVLNELRLLRVIAKDSVNEGYAERDWCARVKPPKVRTYTRANPNLLSAAQLHALIDKIPPQWKGLVLFMATTGLRWGEASALHWEDVTLDANGAGEAFIHWGNDRGVLVPVKTKRSERGVPVLAVVSELWGVRRPRGLVFPTRKGRLHRGSPLRKVLDKAIVDAKVPRVTAHGLRRTFNNLARQRTSREILKSITGHTTDAMVEHYSMVGADEKMIVSRDIAELAGVLKVSQPATEEGEE
jgi:integrase